MAEKYNISNIKFMWYNYKEFYEAEQKVYNQSNQNININIFEKELKDINGTDDEHYLESNEIKILDNNINNESKEEEDIISSENEALINNELIEPINDENCDNLEGESFIKNFDKIISEQSSYYKDYEELLNFKISVEQSNTIVYEHNDIEIKTKYKFEFKKKKRCYNEVIKDKNDEDKFYHHKLWKKKFKAY